LAPPDRLLDHTKTAVYRPGRNGWSGYLGFGLSVAMIPSGGGLYAGQTQISLLIEVHRVRKESMFFRDIIGLVCANKIGGKSLKILGEILRGCVVMVTPLTRGRFGFASIWRRTISAPMRLNVQTPVSSHS
jgi:hypothetical protein